MRRLVEEGGAKWSLWSPVVSATAGHQTASTWGGTGRLGYRPSGGFSIDASVQIAAHDRAGLQRLLRYCARPPFALERMETTGYGATGGERIVYRLPHPAPGGGTALLLTPLEVLKRLALLIPPPRIHRHRYHGVLAPNARLRYQVIAFGREQGTAQESNSGQLGAQSAAGSPDGAELRAAWRSVRCGFA